MSDSGELLFGDLTDAEDGDPNSIHKTDGTAYPHHLTRVAGDSDSESSSETYSPAPSRSGDITSSKKASRSLSRLKQKRSRRSSLHKLMSTTNTEFSDGEIDPNHDDVSKPPNPSLIPHRDAAAGSVQMSRKKKRFLNGRSRPNHHALSNQDSSEEDELYDVDLAIPSSPKMGFNSLHSVHSPFSRDDSRRDSLCWYRPWTALKTLHRNGHSLSVLLTVSVLIAGGGCISGHIAAEIVVAVLYVLYLTECVLNKTWKELAAKRRETANATVNLLGVNPLCGYIDGVICTGKCTLCPLRRYTAKHSTSH